MGGGFAVLLAVEYSIGSLVHGGVTVKQTPRVEDHIRITRTTRTCCWPRVAMSTNAIS
jgi:hypothetical protein